MTATSFQQRVRELNSEYDTFGRLHTVQVNLGNLCNLNCAHCHVDASCRGTEIMGTAVMDQVIRFLARCPDLVLDITGGCPEMNPDFRYLIEQTDGLASRRMVRSNLAVMADQEWQWLPEFCRSHELTVIGSLPCYLEVNVDRQRGAGVYQSSIQVLKKLNSLGYGTEIELDLVYNPGGCFVPGSQQELEAAYKMQLLADHGVIFNHLFTITNAPIGRFRERLDADGMYEEYLCMLEGRFNPDAAGNVMCRTLISVDWQGKVYNCDFNQALGTPMTAEDGSEITIAELDVACLNGKRLDLDQHCYCCTAGEGSSCTGALVS